MKARELTSLISVDNQPGEENKGSFSLCFNNNVANDNISEAYELYNTNDWCSYFDNRRSAGD